MRAWWNYELQFEHGRFKVPPLSWHTRANGGGDERLESSRLSGGFLRPERSPISLNCMCFCLEKWEFLLWNIHAPIAIGGEFRAHGSRFNGTFHLAVVVFGKSARNLILDTCGMLIEAVSTVDSNPTRFRVEAAFSQKPPRRTDVPSRFVEAAAVGLHS
jgi:hypothetical protein